ncbi:MAG: protoheme IX farnesyltransferase [Infirmifilum uzonense]
MINCKVNNNFTRKINYVKASIKDILFGFFKLKQSLLAVWIGILAFLAASGLKPNLYYLFLTILSLTFTVFGSTGLNMVLDADIDSLMPRTSWRPIPSGKLGRLEGALLSLSLLVAGLVIGALVNEWVFIAGLLGFILFVPLYTLFLKRKTPWSTLICGFAGGMPALGGWTAVTGSPGIEGVLLLLLAGFWSNLHIWSLATYYAEDYRKANVPMLPVVKGEKTGLVGALTMGVIVGILTYALWAVGLIGLIGFLLSILPLLVSLFYIVRGLTTGDYKTWSYKAFKMASIYMAVVFLALILK